VRSCIKRARIMTSPVFTGERIIGAILFENPIDRDIEGEPTGPFPRGEPCRSPWSDGAANPR
jgi:hypothetical protein